MTRGWLIILFFSISLSVQAQVQWLSFDALDSAMQVEEKPIFVEFYTSWCTYCKKMDQEVFPDQKVAEVLNNGFYAVKFDAESSEEITFDGLTFKKAEGETYHPLVMLLASKKGEFAPPVFLFLDKDFKVNEKVNAYLSRKKILAKLRKYSHY